MSETILVIGPAWIGDMVMAQSLFKLIKQRRPQAQIEVVAPAWAESLLARMPEVAQAFSLPVGHRQLGLGSRWELGRQLRDRSMNRPSFYRTRSSPRLSRSLPPPAAAPACSASIVGDC